MLRSCLACTFPAASVAPAGAGAAFATPDRLADAAAPLVYPQARFTDLWPVPARCAARRQRSPSRRRRRRRRGARRSGCSTTDDSSTSSSALERSADPTPSLSARWAKHTVRAPLRLRCFSARLCLPVLARPARHVGCGVPAIGPRCIRILRHTRPDNCARPPRRERLAACVCALRCVDGPALAHALQVRPLPLLRHCLPPPTPSQAARPWVLDDGKVVGCDAVLERPPPPSLYFSLLGPLRPRRVLHGALRWPGGAAIRVRDRCAATFAGRRSVSGGWSL